MSPVKIALPTTNRPASSNAQNFPPTPKVNYSFKLTVLQFLNPQQLIIVSNASSSNTSSILQKTLSFPMKTNAGKSTVIYQPISSSSPNTPEPLKQRPKSMQSTPLPKGRSTIVVSQKTPMKQITPGKHVMPMQAKMVVQKSGQGGQLRTQKPQHVFMQKPGKQAVVTTNLQVKTPQGYTNLPVQLRPTPKPKDGPVKMLSIAGGAKILPKPSQPVYVVTGTTTPLTMVTRTVPASCPPRVMTVSTAGPKWNQNAGKSVQMVAHHLQRRGDGVLMVQKGAKPVVSHGVKVWILIYSFL